VGSNSGFAGKERCGPDSSRQLRTVMRLSTMTRPSKLKLTMAPQRRFEAFDVAARITEAGDLLRKYQRVLFCSPHTTAGYLDRSLALRMHNRYDLLSQFFRAFRALFPQGAE